MNAQNYQDIVGELIELVEHARRTASRSINSIMTATYWLLGQRIVNYEQDGKDRAGYGQALLERLSDDLTRRCGRGFSARNLAQIRRFYLEWEIPQTLSAESISTQGVVSQNSQTVSAESAPIAELSAVFRLPWSHYVQLMALDNPEARAFYEEEALRGGWSVRQLRRQIGTQFYERAALSKNKVAMLKRGRQLPQDELTLEQQIKDPYVLEFLTLKDEYSERDLEEALIVRLEAFLLELGNDFAFIGRQRRLRVGDEWYRVDLLFFHRRLRCLIVIDLKLDKFTHADAGQMHLYLNYAREHWTLPDENPPVGLILCAQKDAAVAHYALEGLPNKILAAEYRVALPDEELLADELRRTRRLLEERQTV